jgi:hypothetical protein
MSDVFSFQLSDDFIGRYETIPAPFGFRDAGQNSLGEITFIRTYSRVKDDGTKERWHEVCRRVIEGMYSVQKNWAKENRLPFNDNKAQKSAQEAYDRMFTLKWTPPGRGLWAFGTPMTMERRNSASLQNCAMLSTRDINHNDPGAAFAWVMDALMLGIGVGFDTLGRDKGIVIQSPLEEESTYIIPDSREGWVESVRLLLNSFLKKNQPTLNFDYGLVRPAGAPIRGFGGVASGPGPLEKLHNDIRKVIGTRAGQELDSRAIVDTVNLIGTCVVAGNVRRSATLALGQLDDKEFINLKNADEFPERNSFDPENPGWAWMSNNSIEAQVGTKYEDYVDLIVDNGEPGFIWLDVARSRGRMIDPVDNKDFRVMGFNPCAEQPLESYELCVSGDTLLQTRTGAVKIGDAVGRDIEIWNGEKWAQVSPFYTGVNDLYRVTLSDGSHLDATPGHEWIAKTKTQKNFRTVKTSELEPGMYLPEFSLGEVDGVREENAYVYGFVCGDGYVDGNRVMALVTDDKYVDLGGTEYKGQEFSTGTKFRRVNVSNKVALEHALEMRKGDSLPDVIFGWDSQSISEFFGGWIDTDGSLIKNPNTDHYVLYGSENKLRQAQMLLRRIGVDHSTVRIFSPEGTVTNVGTRNHDLYRLLIPSYEAEAIATKIKVASRFGPRYANNNAHPGSMIDRARKQKVVSVEKIASDAPTYCLNEPDTNRAVFGNVLTKQCTLVEVHLNRHDSKEDFLRTLKFAYLYGKTVTLLPTHWQQTNGIMQRNRRIGTSLTGIASFADVNGLPTTREWMDEGYDKIRYYDHKYSEWLCVRESIRVTTVKPSGSVSLLSGASPGVHWPVGGKHFLRAIRFGNSDPMLHLFKAAGYRMEDDLVSANTTVVYFPVESDHPRSEKDVTLFEKIGLAATAQRYWSDNGVSVTLSFDAEKERDHVAPALHLYEGELKAVSFLPMGNAVYPQQPYQQITEEEYNSYVGSISTIDFSAIYEGIDNLEALGERYCANDACTI